MKGEFGRKTLAKLRPDCPGSAHAPPRRALPDDLGSRSSSIESRHFQFRWDPPQRAQSIPSASWCLTSLPNGNTDKIHQVGCAFGHITNTQNDRRSVQLALKCFWQVHFVAWFWCGMALVGRPGAILCVGSQQLRTWFSGFMPTVPAAPPLSSPGFTPKIYRMASRLIFALSFLLACHKVPGAQQATNREPVAGAKTSARETVQAHIGKAHEDLKDQRYREAAEEFDAALKLDPHLVDIRYQLGVCYFAIGQRKEARKELERVRTETRNDPAAIYYLGRMDLTEGNLDSAIELLNGLMSKPPFPDTAYYLGSASLKKGDAAAAEKWLRKAAEVDPRDFRIPDHLARVYQKLGRRQDA